jgi:Ca-activated chloride channel family protein
LALFTLALAALAISLARPQKTIQVPVERASVVLVTDVSFSMSATDVNPTRLDAARQAALNFLGKVPDSLRVGLVAFSDEAQTLHTPTTDRRVLADALQTLQPINGTATGAGLRAALNDLNVAGGTPAAHRPPAAIVLLSDGSATDGTAADDVALEAGRLHVPIHTVALGTPNGTFTRHGEVKAAPPDPAALARIAAESGGKAFRAQDADELGSVYGELGSQIGTKPEKREITSTFAGLALLMLGGALASSLALGGRLP